MRPRIRAVARAVLVAGVIGTVGAVSAGCVKIDGGAVEVSWVVRSQTGAAITDCSCAQPAISTVRLVLVLDVAGSPADSGSPSDSGSPTDYRPCSNQAQCDFPCQRQTGATAFDIRPTQANESYEISVIGVDSTGAVIATTDLMTPAPILRSVMTGQATVTEAFELVARCSPECMMNGSGVCARP
jgi:hypothetical protein